MEQATVRHDGRLPGVLRPHSITRNVQPHAYGSLLFRMGGTEVICAVSLEERVPDFLAGSGQGWITAEYSLLPGATAPRYRREIGSRSGRSLEIQRLIGRSLRMMVDLHGLGEHTLRVDCDVLNADGGTRTASITGGALALRDALMRMQREQRIHKVPDMTPLAAVSAGIVEDTVLLDLDYHEDARAQADGNFVMTGAGHWIEVQTTAETRPIGDDEFSRMQELARQGITELLKLWA